MMRPASAMVLAALLLGLAHLNACAPAARQSAGEDDWPLDRTSSRLTGDLDAAEVRWRKEIAASRAEEDWLLADDPPGVLSTNREITTEKDESESPPPPQTFWGRMKAGVNTFGKATFAAFAVLGTLGMMAAPYVIMAV